MRPALAPVAALTLGLAALWTAFGEAHKPITSKYTFNEHVSPIFRDHCGACHFEGGAAPMSLITYADARPWAESIRAELVAARMPPSQADSAVGPFRNARLLPPRDLDVVLTWATGGTPEGPAGTKPAAIVRQAEWPLGPPDVTIPIPAEVTLPPRALGTTEAFRLPSSALEDRAIRAVDLRPGTPAMVRRAIIYIQPRQPDPTEGPLPERVVGFWSPDRDIVSPADDEAFTFPKGAELVARITYRKTWKYENTAMSDRSTVGVYFADRLRAREVVAIAVTNSTVIADDVQAVAVRSEVNGGDADVAVTAVMPDESRIRLIRFLEQREWPQRFWFAEPVTLPRGTRLESAAGAIVDVVRAGR